MKTLLVVGLVLTSLAIHALIWRTRKPELAVRWFLIYPLGLFPLAYIAAIHTSGLHDIFDSLLIVLAYELGFAAYVLMYPAIEQSSLSLDIIQYLKKAGGSVPLGRIVDGAAATDIIDKRIEQLEAEGVVKRDGNEVAITERGRRIASILQKLRKVLVIRVYEG